MANEIATDATIADATLFLGWLQLHDGHTLVPKRDDRYVQMNCTTCDTGMAFGIRKVGPRGNRSGK